MSGRRVEVSIDLLQNENAEKLNELRSIVAKMKGGAQSLLGEVSTSQPVLDHIEGDMSYSSATLRSNMKTIDKLKEFAGSRFCWLTAFGVVVLFILVHFFLKYGNG
eukprot:TRINITY_DN4867_c0_g2_i7.p1 TRINITY_DN4867_c0_g2~~TRINITY_DN4867_c0_g2_i7.p1  ORF type:complete len:106 (+),score=17.33 TRINITY_DN4867_c0_g2_i7:79-396(+)